MIDAAERTGQIYDNFAGTENDLNHVLSLLLIPNMKYRISATRGMLICLKSNQYSKTTRMNS